MVGIQGDKHSPLNIQLIPNASMVLNRQLNIPKYFNAYYTGHFWHSYYFRDRMNVGNLHTVKIGKLFTKHFNDVMNIH